jgi:hypothetical protein
LISKNKELARQELMEKKSKTDGILIVFFLLKYSSGTPHPRKAVQFNDEKEMVTLRRSFTI